MKGKLFVPIVVAQYFWFEMQLSEEKVNLDPDLNHVV